MHGSGLYTQKLHIEKYVLLEQHTLYGIAPKAGFRGSTTMLPFIPSYYPRQQCREVNVPKHS